MPERGETEMFSNPLPPTTDSYEGQDDSHPMTNEDFRKLMMTPRVPSMGSVSTPSRASKVAEKTSVEDEDDPATRRRKKKSYYAKLKRQEEERQKELADRYRDRAQERREGQNHDYEQTEIISTTADYRAVAPDAKSGESYAERRKQLIQESKYLGGDMEHTHLVKGLDYALLEKVRAEITSKEAEDEELEHIVNDKQEKEEPDPEEQIHFRTKMGRNLFRILFKTRLPERNDLFLPGRMAYVVDLEDYIIDTDIPNTLIRSKADCPSLESTTTMTTNDIVINKLTQILSYLRQGRRESKKLKKKEKGKPAKEEEKTKGPEADEGIYAEVGDYAPSYNKSSREKDRGKDRDRRDRDRDRDRDRRDRDRDRHDRYDRDRHDRDRNRDRHDRDRDERSDRKRSYFEKPAEEDDARNERDRPATSAREMVKSINEKFSKGWAPADLEREASLRSGEVVTGSADGAAARKPKEDERSKKMKTNMVIDSYAECYPGMVESYDAIDDSDDEVDYTKMDQGNKKGPIGRWDFDTQEEYSDYMANKEALPKAAFQYGVKMADGRKTRRTGPKDEKAELDREWQKIQNIINKRKAMGTDGQPYKKSAKY